MSLKKNRRVKSNQIVKKYITNIKKHFEGYNRNLIDIFFSLFSKLTDNEKYIYLFVILLIAFVAVILVFLRATLDNAHIGLIFLLIVVGVASVGGTKPALFASILSFLSWNFLFFEPYHTLRIKDPGDWLLLFIFLLIGIIVGQITGNIRVREKETEALYKASLSANQSLDIEEALNAMVEQVSLNIASAGCAILKINLPDSRKPETEEFHMTVGTGNLEEIEEDETKRIIRWVINNRKSAGLANLPELFLFKDVQWPESVPLRDILGYSTNRQDVFLLLEMNSNPLGVLYVKMSKKPSIFHYRFIIIISLIVTTAMEKFRLLEEKTRTMAAKESEHLKSIMFSSMSHNLKNPLVSLTATLSSLRLEDQGNFSAELMAEHLSIMEEDVKKLTENIDKLLNLSQLKSGIWKPRFDWYDIREVVSSVITQFSDLDYQRLIVNIPDEFIMIWVDLVQIGQVLRHLLENALRYSLSGSKVAIGAEVLSDSILFWVEDEGTGTDDDNIAFVKNISKETDSVEKTYKRTGLGLAICQEIVKFHQGNISMEKIPRKGYRFVVTLPIKLLDR